MAQEIDKYGDPVRIALLGDVKTIDKITDEFRDRLYETEIEKKYDATIEVSGVTLADLESRGIINTNRIILLWGPDPQHYLAGSKDEREVKRTHRDFDRQSLVDSRAWTELLKTHPEIIQRTIQYLNNKVHELKSAENRELLEWRNILESMSFQRLKRFLESDSERSTRLRQSLPFWPVLKESERAKLDKIKSEHIRDHE